MRLRDFEYLLFIPLSKVHDVEVLNYYKKLTVILYFMPSFEKMNFKLK